MAIVEVLQDCLLTMSRWLCWNEPLAAAAVVVVMMVTAAVGVKSVVVIGLQ